jgi:hypothetical protein
VGGKLEVDLLIVHNEDARIVEPDRLSGLGPGLV